MSDGTIDLGQQPGRVRYQVEPYLVLLLQLAEQPGLVLQYQALGHVESGRRFSAGGAETLPSPLAGRLRPARRDRF